MFSFGTRKTVDSILSAFTKAVKDLEEVEVQSERDAAEADLIIAQKEAEREAALAEGARAATVRQKLTDLLS